MRMPDCDPSTQVADLRAAAVAPEARGRAAACNRRQFLTLGAGTFGVLALSSLGPARVASGASKGADIAHYLSRPDLKPSLVDITGPSGPPAPGYLCVNPTGPLMLANDGETIWVRNVANQSTNLRVQQYSGQPVLTWWQGKIAHYGVGLEGEYVIVDGSYNEIMRVQGQNGLPADLHEFLITPEGIAYFTAYRTFHTDLRPVGGPRSGPALDATIQGVDLATGELVFEWRSLDHIELTESKLKYNPKFPFDPVHLNSVDLMRDGSLLVSARNTWCLYKLDRGTGAVIWRLGGKKSDFILGPDVRFAWQHDARQQSGNGISLFDDEGDPAEAKQSRGLLLEVDETARTATVQRSFEHPSKSVLAGSQGSMQLLANGDVLVGWGSEPYFTEYRADGSLVMDGRFEAHQSYRTLRFPWTGTPSERPAIAVRHAAKGGWDLYASWNGSTETQSWEAYGGPHPTALSLMGAAERTGFETRIRVLGEPSYLAARALDGGGRVLASSPVMGTAGRR